jgi:hypothetical protein
LELQSPNLAKRYSTHMKKLFIFTALLLFMQAGYAQVLFSEDFQSYQGFGSTLTGGWSTPIGGFKVYLRSVPSDTAIKICETVISNNHKKDSLTTPSFGPLTENATLTFKSRIVDGYTANMAVFNHIPVAGDKVSAYVSADGGTSFTFLQELIPGYPSSGTGFATSLFP